MDGPLSNHYRTWCLVRMNLNNMKTSQPKMTADEWHKRKERMETNCSFMIFVFCFSVVFLFVGILIELTHVTGNDRLKLEQQWTRIFFGFMFWAFGCYVAEIYDNQRLFGVLVFAPIIGVMLVILEGRRVN